MAEESTNTAQNAQNGSETTSTVDATTNTETTTEPAQGKPEATQTNASQQSIEELIQKAVDRATNKLGNENKKLRGQLDKLKSDKLTDDELKQLEIADREADIADREAKLQERENRLFAIKAIKDIGLDDGGPDSLALVDFVMCDNEEDTTARVKAFDSLVKKFVSAEVNRTFKDNGRNPEKSGNTTTDSKTSIAADIGKAMADRNATANNVLKHYLGGK